MDRLLPWLRGTGLVYVLVAVGLAALAWRMTGGSSGAAERPETPAGAVRVEAGPAAGGALLVHVAGAVRRPGVYRLPAAARVEAAVARAGGATGRADLAGLNLAARLEDGQQVVVPRRVSAGSVPGAAPGAQGPISLSSASAEQLDAIDGIGPTLAARIVDWRRQHGGFASVDQLLEVPGIGEGRLEALKGAVVP